MTGPMRCVVYIGVQVGNRGGKAWALVLRCGHTVFKGIAPFNFVRSVTSGRGIARGAPRRARCYHCDMGLSAVDLDAAVGVARRIYEGSLELL